MWNARSIHLGKGEQDSFYRCLGWIKNEHPSTFLSNHPSLTLAGQVAFLILQSMIYGVLSQPFFAGFSYPYIAGQTTTTLDPLERWTAYSFSETAENSRANKSLMKTFRNGERNPVPTEIDIVDIVDITKVTDQSDETQVLIKSSVQDAAYYQRLRSESRLQNPNSVHPELIFDMTRDGSFKCPTPECSHIFTTAARLFDHLAEKYWTSVAFKGRCKLCDQPKKDPYVSYASMLEHIPRHFPPTIRCIKLYCLFMAVTPAALNHHIRRLHETPISRLYECRYCSFTTPHRGTYWQHGQKHSGDKETACNRCGKMVKPTRMQAHRSNQCPNRPPAVYLCDYPSCHAVFVKMARRNYHMRNTHGRGESMTEWSAQLIP